MPRYSSQVPSVAVPPRLPLVTTIQNRDASFDRDSRLVNAFAERNPVTEDYSVEKRPGLDEMEHHSGVGGGVYNWNDIIYSIFGVTIYKDGVVFGTVDSTGGIYAFEELLGTGWLILNNGVKAYYTDGTAFVEIATFLPVLAGAFNIGSSYQIVSSGTTNFVAIGAANNNVGTVFTATGLGDPLTTGTAALVAGSLQPAGLTVTLPIPAYQPGRRGWAHEDSPILVPSTTADTGSLLVGVTYQINTVGTTDFTLIGASANVVGTVFVATGVGAGTGTVLLPNFPQSHVKGWAYLDGTLYVMDSNARIYGTSTLRFGGIGGFDDPRLWDPLNVIVARTGHGNGIALAKHGAYVVAMKSETTEFFYDAANVVASPLHTVQGAYSNYGCASEDSVQDMQDVLIWISHSNRASAPQVVMLKDLNATPISTPPIERLLRSADFTDVASWNFSHCGHRFYGVTIVNSNITLVFDLGENLWYSWTDEDGDYWPIVAHTVGPTLQSSIVQHRSNGKLYYAAADYVFPTDDGSLIPVDIYTPNFDGEVDRRKVLGAMYFNADQQPGSKLQLRVSDDDYQTWSNFREVDLSARVPVLTNCGTFYRRAFHFRHQCNTPMRLRSVGLQVDLGTL